MRGKVFHSILLFLLIALFAACESKGQEVVVGSMSGETLSSIVYENKESVMIIDVRGEGEYASGHIYSAVNIPLNTLESAIATLPRDKELILYCKSGYRSGKAAKILVKNGFTKVTNAKGVGEFNYSLVR